MIPVATSASDRFFKAKTRVAQPAASQTKSVIRNILSVLNPDEKRRFAVLIVLDIVISTIDILSLALLVWIIQFYVQPGTKNSLSFLPAWMADRNSIVFIAVFFLLFSFKNLAAFLIAKAQNNFTGNVAVRISDNNLHTYQNAAFEEFIQVDSSVHVRKIAYQPFDFCQYLLSGIQQIITQTFLIGLTILAILLFNAKLFLLLLLILLPPVVAVFYFIKLRLTKAKLHIKSSNEKSFQRMMDALKGFVEGNIYHRNDFFRQRFTAQRRIFSKHLFNSISLQTLPGRLIEIFAVMGLFILIAIAKWSGANDSAALITTGAFIAAAYKIIPGLVKIINITGQMKAYEFSMEEIIAKERQEETTSLNKRDIIHSLQFENICFRYKELPVLSNINFTVQQGDFIGITGRSGKGKTTLFNLLLGFLAPSDGKIIINDLSLNKNELKEFWPSVSYVRQQSFFIHDTLLRNITLEEETHNEKKLDFAVKISGLEEFIQQSPQGLHSIITENGKNISGGQQQRIALARAVYKDAHLILLDEPFNELDETSELELLHHFKSMADSGRIVIMITHNKEALSFCTKTISLDEP